MTGADETGGLLGGAPNLVGAVPPRLECVLELSGSGT
jgi:hypothetical protein